MKKLILCCFGLLMTSCAWLTSHPQVEADLEQEGVDVAKDTEKTVEDIIQPHTTVAP